MKRKSDWVFPDIAPSIVEASAGPFGALYDRHAAAIERALIALAFILGLGCSFFVF